METFSIRIAKPDDRDRLAAMRHALWPDVALVEHSAEADALLAGKLPGIMTWILFVAETAEHQIAGFIEADLRSHADGCDPSHAVAFVEGWFVEPQYRRKKIGALLMAEVETWARSQGCREMASDTWLDHADSQNAHQALGFEEVDRCVHYRKTL